MGERKLKFQDRWMFNRVLCEEEVCRKVLRAALGIEAGEIAYLNAEQCFEPLAAGRGVRLDVFARGDGRVYDIEMQVARERDLGRRMRYYQAAMDVGELGSACSTRTGSGWTACLPTSRRPRCAAERRGRCGGGQGASRGALRRARNMRPTRLCRAHYA